VPISKNRERLPIHPLRPRRARRTPTQAAWSVPVTRVFRVVLVSLALSLVVGNILAGVSGVPGMLDTLGTPTAWASTSETAQTSSSEASGGSSTGEGDSTGAGPPIVVRLDGYPMEFDVPPIIIDGRTLVPFRFLAEALGCDVSWDEGERRVTAVDSWNGREIVLWVDRTEALVDGRTRTLDVPAMIINGRTLIPLRFFSESTGAGVEWQAETRTVTVASPCRPMEVLGYYALGTQAQPTWDVLFGRPYPGAGVGLTDVVSKVACAWYVLDPATGHIITDDYDYSSQTRPDGWRDILDRCGRSGVRAEMMVHWAKLNETAAISLFLADPEARSRAAAEIVGFARDFGGVNLDIEYLGRRQEGAELENTRARFTDFVRLLREELPEEKTLTLSLHPLNGWFPGYDWAALGELADRIVIMAYGYVQNQPQPVEEVLEAVRLATEVVPAEKLLLGVLADWETADTLAVQVGLAKRAGLAGVAVWRVNKIRPEHAEVMRAAMGRPPLLEIALVRETWGETGNETGSGTGSEAESDTGGETGGSGQAAPGDTTSPARAELGLARFPVVMLEGRYYVPLLPLLEALDIQAVFDPAAERATVQLGVATRVLQAASDGSTGIPVGPGETGPVPGQPIIVRGTIYTTVEEFVELVDQYSPPGVVDAVWKPDDRELQLLLLSPTP